jgi:hypothetical protein
VTLRRGTETISVITRCPPTELPRRMPLLARNKTNEKNQYEKILIWKITGRNWKLHFSKSAIQILNVTTGFN